MATLTKTMFSIKTLNQVFLLGVLMVAAACGSDDSGRAKRNSRDLYRIDVTSRTCHGVRLQKTFTSQRDVCEYLEYEARSNNCLYNELNQEYQRFNCQAGYYNGYDSGVYNPVYPAPNGPGELPANVPPLPSEPSIILTPREQATFWNDLNDSLNALNSYYSVDASGCLASIKGTTDVIDLCVDGGPGHGEKDGDYIPDSYTPEKDAPYSPEKDDEYVAQPSKPAKPTTPAEKPTPTTPAPTAPPKGGDTTTPTPATPAPSTGGKLAYNLVHFNARSLLPQEVNRVPVLRITGTVDPNSPIYNLRHSSPSDIKAIELSNITTQCPMRAQLSSSGSTVVLTLVVEAGSSDAQIQACRAFFNDFASVSSFDFKFKEPLKMSNGSSINQPFQFSNK